MLEDPSLRLYRGELEHSNYESAGKTSVIDLAAKRDHNDEAAKEYTIGQAMRTLLEPVPDVSDLLRSCWIDPGIDILLGWMALQIGEVLWRILHPDLGAGIPTAFLSRHVLLSRKWIGLAICCSRYGPVPVSGCRVLMSGEGKPPAASCE